MSIITTHMLFVFINVPILVIPMRLECELNNTYMYRAFLRYFYHQPSEHEHSMGHSVCWGLPCFCLVAIGRGGPELSMFTYMYVLLFFEVTPLWHMCNQKMGHVGCCKTSLRQTMLYDSRTRRGGDHTAIGWFRHIIIMHMSARQAEHG